MSDLQEFRAAKDEFFRTSDQSPLTPGQRQAFAGLAYYGENPSLVFHLRPEPFADPERVQLQTSTGDLATYLRWAEVRFEVEGEEARLTLFRDEDSGSLFLPFQDAGAGDETYGAGRYMDLELEPDGSLVLDFNDAYNPYCAYNEHWSCPLPPPENRLAVHIRAGERDFVGSR